MALLAMIILASCQQTSQTVEDKRIEFKIDSIMRQMTLDEEIGQMVLFLEVEEVGEEVVLLLVQVLAEVDKS